jgi:hypothetical protein
LDSKKSFNVKRLLKWLLVFFAILIPIIIFGGHYLIDNVLAYAPIKPLRVTGKTIAKYFDQKVSPEQYGLSYSNFDLNEPKGTIIILHGIASCKETMLGIAAVLADTGYNCILYDSRANGESGGKYCTYGYYEKEDVSKYIDAAISKYKNAVPFGIYGHSLGAAVAVQAMAKDHRIKCGVIVSPFADLREIIHDYVKNISFIPFYFFSNMIVDKSGEIANFPVDSVKPEISAKQITQPVIIIHGLNDKRISPDNGKRIYNNIASKEKEWYPIPGGGHNNLSIFGGSKFKNKVINFYLAHLK